MAWLSCIESGGAVRVVVCCVCGGGGRCQLTVSPGCRGLLDPSVGFGFTDHRPLKAPLALALGHPSSWSPCSFLLHLFLLNHFTAP